MRRATACLAGGATGKQIQSLTPDDGAFGTFEWSPDSTRIVAAGKASSVYVIDTDSGQTAFARRGYYQHFDPIGVRLSADSSRLFVGCDEKAFVLSLREIARPRIADVHPYNWEWSPDESRLATSLQPGPIEIWSGDFSHRESVLKHLRGGGGNFKWSSRNQLAVITETNTHIYNGAEKTLEN